MKFAKIFGAAFIAIGAFSLVFVPGADNNYGSIVSYSSLHNSIVSEVGNIINQ